jgi:hypothetical protein
MGVFADFDHTQPKSIWNLREVLLIMTWPDGRLHDMARRAAA